MNRTTPSAPSLVVQGRFSPARRRARRWAAFVSMPALLWAALWAGINSGPWVLETEPRGLLGWAHYLRTPLPLVALALACVTLVGRQVLRSGRNAPLTGPLRLWIAYGLVGPFASRVKTVIDEDQHFYNLIREVMVAALHNHAPNICVEVGRQNTPANLRPSYNELEGALRASKQSLAA